MISRISFFLNVFKNDSLKAMLGMMVAGCYGLPQFRMRVFIWAAVPTEVTLLRKLFHKGAQ